ncbi:hypothetical protein G5C60_17350 [Streptomyces sp. HC44]|uniref:DUF4760 domain-containing protein n=1 Tax=Streptomyces scabichelini TaxID=2711217 RepID=A0A6G4V632_9ACTN|nr:hypothetical protein [Streptomyces scabichelini]NGO09317.1 hypothetical protein [Streptomyces scabichelini]
MGLNIAALAISVVALLFSSVIAYGQLRSTQKANALAMIFDGFREGRSPEFRKSMEYVLYHLKEEFPGPISYLELPEEPKECVRRVAFFFEELGKLVVHGFVSQDLIIGSYGLSMHRAWVVVAPYVYREREIRQRVVLPYFEHMAAVTSEITAADVHRKMKLRTYPPTS